MDDCLNFIIQRNLIGVLKNERLIDYLNIQDIMCINLNRPQSMELKKNSLCLVSHNNI
jgi:hypothetical protein